MKRFAILNIYTSTLTYRIPSNIVPEELLLCNVLTTLKLLSFISFIPSFYMYVVFCINYNI